MNDFSSKRDEQLGHALQALTDPPTRDQFWQELSTRLAEVDGDAGDGHGFNGEQDNGTGDGGWNVNRGGILLVAAAALVALAAAAAMINPFDRDDGTEVKAVDQTENDESDDGDETANADDESDGSTDDAEGNNEGGDDESNDGATDATGSPGTVNYQAEPTVFALPDQALVVAGMPNEDLILLSVPVPNSEGTGCEGEGRSELQVQSSDGSVRQTAGEGAADSNVVLANNQGRLLLSTLCEEFVDINGLGSIGPDGELRLETPVESVYASMPDVVIATRPFWSADGSTFYINASDSKGDQLLVSFDGATGALIGNVAVDGVVLAELDGGVFVEQTETGVRIANKEISLIEDNILWAEAAVSPDGKLVAVWNQGKLFVIDPTGEVRYWVEDESAIADADWSPTGTLVAIKANNAELLIIDPEAPEPPIEINTPASSIDGSESAFWGSVRLVDNGRVIAVSSVSVDAEQSAYALRFPTVTGSSPGEEAAPPSISSQPLGLRSMGPIEIGMTVPEASEASGLDIKVDVFEEVSDVCHFGRVSDDPDSPFFMVITEPGADPQAGVIARIDLNEGQATRSGIRIGSSRDDVIAAYGDRIESSPHTYTDGEYLTFVPTDPDDAQYRLVMEVTDDRVTAVRAGRVPEVNYVEGCL